MMGWRGILAAVLLLAALLSGWSVWTHRAHESPDGPASERSDYQLYDFELVVLDAAGAESFTLKAPHMARQPGDETLALETPVFLFPVIDDGGRKDQWEVRSRTGWVSAEGDEVRLAGDVVATGPGAGATRATLETQRLAVFPRKDFASSDQRVTIKDGRSTIRGRGLEVNLATKKYVLLADVESRYVPFR